MLSVKDRTATTAFYGTSRAVRWPNRREALRGTVSFKASVCYTSPWAAS